MDRCRLILTLLEQEEAEQWDRLSIAIEDLDAYSDFAEIDFQLKQYQMARRLLLEARILRDSQPIALLKASKEE